MFLFFMTDRQKTALISVYDKTGIVDFAKSLVDLGWKIISSGGTAKHLMDAGIEVTDVAEITGMPAILSHRVVTLHPKIHGGLLALDTPEHMVELEKYGIPFIDLVCCDLYPLQDEVNNPNATRESVIEKTDIGGPTMLRSAAKGGRITICDVADRNKVIKWLKEGEANKEEFINNLRAKTEFVVANYCLVSARYHSQGKYDGLIGEQIAICKYGENAWQTPAGLYSASQDKFSLEKFSLLSGTPPSYNNLADLDRLLQTMTHIAAGLEVHEYEVPYLAVGVKHGNACGAAYAKSAKEVIERMLDGDLRAIFGGVVMVNFEIDAEVAEVLLTYKMSSGRRLLDMVIAPSFTQEAIEMMKRKGDKCRFLVNKNLGNLNADSLDTARRFRYVRGGFLAQPNYTFVPKLDPARHLPLSKESKIKEVILAWAVGCTSNSNTITIVKDGRLYGNGVGQQDRVGAAKLALSRADEANNGKADLENAVAYSDSFFPFPDAPEVLIDRGIKTIFSTSGSVNDEKIIELCKQKGVNLIMLPDSEARGFYQH